MVGSRRTNIKRVSIMGIATPKVVFQLDLFIQLANNLNKPAIIPTTIVPLLTR